VGSPPSITATTELVVPKSIPIILLIILVSEFVELPPLFGSSSNRPFLILFETQLS
jgi:hypothetical protein